jgi:hypothetical protein
LRRRYLIKDNKDVGMRDSGSRTYNMNKRLERRGYERSWNFGIQE